MRRVFLIILLLFIFAPLTTLFGSEESVLESARKAGFVKPAEGICPLCKADIVVDLSAETSECPYCKEIFLSKTVIKQIADKQTLPYNGSPEMAISESATDKRVSKKIVHDKKYGDIYEAFLLYFSPDDTLSKTAKVNLAKIFDTYQKTNDLDKELEKRGDVKLKEKERLVKEMQDVESKTRFIQQFDETAKAELTRERDGMVKDILKEMRDIMKKYGEDNQYKAIYDDRMPQYQYPTMHNDKRPQFKEEDISNKIIKILNDSYKDSKNE